jgi:hypothetical protein
MEAVKEKKSKTADNKNIARTMDIEIPHFDRYGDKNGERVPVEKYDGKVVSVADNLVSRMYKGYRVIYLSEKESVNTLGAYRRGTYSSFWSTLQRCFNRHIPLAFRPEVLWYMIFHEVGTCIKLNPERYRLYFSNEKEKKTLTVTVDEKRGVDGVPDSVWPQHIKMFSDKILDEMPSQLGEVMMQEFATSTNITDAATTIALMDAASPYFDYHMRYACGIPRIRLDGNPEDYNKLVEASKVLRTMFEKDLGKYFDHLIPVLQTIADHANGCEVDHEFWGSICNLNSGSGGSDGSDDMGGWMTTFVNYVREAGYSKSTLIPKTHFDWKSGLRWLYAGMTPNHVSDSDVKIEDAYRNKVTNVKYIGGIMNVQDDDGFLVPKLGVGVITKEENA